MSKLSKIAVVLCCVPLITLLTAILKIKIQASIAPGVGLVNVVCLVLGCILSAVQVKNKKGGKANAVVLVLGIIILFFCFGAAIMGLIAGNIFK